MRFWYQTAMNKVCLLASLASALLVACVPAPKKAYSPDEAQKLDELTEIMRTNAATMDPLFSIEGDTTYDAATFGKMKEAAALMKGTAGALKERIAPKREPGFAKYVGDFAAGAEALEAAAGSSDAAAASKAIQAMHGACRGCHSDFR